MAEEGADALIEFGTNDVLEFASLSVGFVIVDAESVFEEAFGQTMTAHDIAGAAFAAFG